MLPDAPVFAVFLAAVVALTITPGPDMIYVASRALGQGRAAGVLSAFGVITGTFVHLGLAALGLAELFRYAPWAYDLVRYLGAAYLLYLAWRVASARDDPGFTAARGSRAGRARSYLQGLTTNPLDPEVALFYLIPTGLDAGRSRAQDRAAREPITWIHATMDDVTIRIDQIYVPAKRRAEIDPARVEGLAENILEDGLKVPISVRQGKGRYVLVAGLQRLEAMKALGEETITAIVVGSPQH